MAIDKSCESDQALHPAMSRIGGTVSIVFSLIGAAFLVGWLVIHQYPPGSHLAWAVAWMVVFAGLCACGIYLIRGQTWAHRALLVFWLAWLVACVVSALGAMQWGQPEWWARFTDVPLGVALGAGLVAGALAAAALVAASQSRLRYATVVAGSVAAAVALVIVGNMISRDRFYRRGFESLGRYGVSERTETILGGLDKPLRLTCVYMGAEEKRKGSDFRPRVMELLEDLRTTARKLGKELEVVNVTSHGQRARIDSSLGSKQRGGKGAKHEEFLKAFMTAAEDIAKRLKSEAARWGKLDGKSYLSQWAIAPQLRHDCDALAKHLDRVRASLRLELAREGMRDYSALVKRARSAVQDIGKGLETYRATLARIAKLPAAVSGNRKDALAAVDAAVKAVDALAEAVGKVSDPAPPEPAQVLEAFIKAAEEAGEKSLAAATALQGIAGKDNAVLVISSAGWVVVVNRTRLGPDEFFMQMAQGVRTLVPQTRHVLKTWTKQKQTEMVAQLRRLVPQLKAPFAPAAQASVKAVDALANIDKPTAKTLKSAVDKKLFAEITSDAEKLVKRADELPELKADTVTDELTGDNIVIVEAGEKMEVIAYDEIWPLRVRPRMGMPPTSDDLPRVFNGDSAIASRILSMTHEPFATVMLAYVPPPRVPRQMQFFQRQPPDPRRLFQEIRKRLEDANLEVQEWDISASMPPEIGDEDADKPAAKNRLLVVLPSLGNMPLSDRQIDNLKTEIDSGTPAVFLMLPRSGGLGVPPDMKLVEYLRDDWGIEVQNKYLLIPTLRDAADPDILRIRGLLLQWMPLSNFSDHPIGRPLQAQRMMWSATATCPVQRAKNVPDGVSVETLLTLPAEQSATFATARIRELAEQFYAGEGGIIQPDFDRKIDPDLRPPFDLAMVASRGEDEAAGRKPSRVVVLGMAVSLMDDYLTRRVEVRGERDTIIPTDPPTMNADLLVNSAYWLVGLEDRIAAGPAVVKPVNIGPTARNVLMALFAIGLPLAVLAAGGCVMLVRRR